MKCIVRYSVNELKKVKNFFAVTPVNYYDLSLGNDALQHKEVCNGGVTCSLLKLGSLEKTVIASLFHSGLHSGTIFLWKKRCHMSL